MFRQFGWMELLLVLVIALLIFGPSKLPQLARSLGKAIREFRESLSGEEGGTSADDSPGEPRQDT